jgi:hypothetical protein
MPASRGENGVQASLRGTTAIVAGSIRESMHDVCCLIWHVAAGEILRREVVQKWERWSRLARSPVG